MTYNQLNTVLQQYPHATVHPIAIFVPYIMF